MILVDARLLVVIGQPMPDNIQRPRTPVFRIESPAALVGQLVRPIVVAEEEMYHVVDESLVVGRVIGGDVELTHHHPFHEDGREVHGSEESMCALECSVLVALDVDLHHGLSERHDRDQIVEQHCVDYLRTRPFAIFHLNPTRAQRRKDTQSENDCKALQLHSLTHTPNTCTSFLFACPEG